MNEQQWLSSSDPAPMLRALQGFHEPVSRTYTGRLKICTDRKLRLFACGCCRAVWPLLVDDAPCYCVTSFNSANPFCAGCGGSGRINRSRNAVEVAERFADGLATDDERSLAGRSIMNHQRTVGESSGGECWQGGLAVWACAPDGHSNLPIAFIRHMPDQAATQAALLRDIFGNPWRPVTPLIRRRVGLGGHRDTHYPCWLSPDVLALARCIYEERRFDWMPQLGDCLEDSGCTDETLLAHCRGLERCPDYRGHHYLIPKPEDCNTCAGTGWIPIRGPHTRGCFLLDTILGHS